MNVDYKSNFKDIKNGLRLSGEQLEETIRLVLREHLWMLLVSNGLEVRFGFDYYMYVRCSRLKTSTIMQMEATGLFVESDVQQREFIITGGRNDD